MREEGVLLSLISTVLLLSSHLSHSLIANFNLDEDNANFVCHSISPMRNSRLPTLSVKSTHYIDAYYEASPGNWNTPQCTRNCQHFLRLLMS
nr:hypothetical transcript [Hymenolepis microstoma]